MELPSPVLTDAVLEDVRRTEVLGFTFLPACFRSAAAIDALRESFAPPPQPTPSGPSMIGYNVLSVFAPRGVP